MSIKQCKDCRQTKPLGEFYRANSIPRERCKACCIARSQARYYRNPERIKAQNRARILKAPQAHMAAVARSWDRKRDLVPDIQPEHIAIPARCPILGIPLTRSACKPTDGTPCIDRVIPALGATPDNWYVCSYRAKRLRGLRDSRALREHIGDLETTGRNPGDLEPLRAILAFLRDAGG